MKKLILLATTVLAAGAIAFITCNQSTRCKMKRQVHHTKKSINRTISRASDKVEKKINMAIDNLADAEAALSDKANSIKSNLKKGS